MISKLESTFFQLKNLLQEKPFDLKKNTLMLKIHLSFKELLKKSDGLFLLR